MRRLWRRFLDQFFPRYYIGYDPAYKNDYSTTVIVKKRRDGHIDVVAWSSIPDEGDSA